MSTIEYKLCAKCGDPVRDSADHALTPDLRCVVCSDEPQDPIDEIKQEAFVEGWFAALETRDREDAEGEIEIDPRWMESMT